MKYIYALSFLILFSGCKNENALDITPAEIDTYVALKSDDSQEYDVTQSLLFSRESDSYRVIKYMQNKVDVLIMELIQKKDESITRKTFYKEGLPVFVSEMIGRNSNSWPFEERKIYLDGTAVLEAYHRTALNENDLEVIDFETWETDFESYDFERPLQAVSQEGDYTMHFSEFINMDPYTYLILENPESKYDVALFIAEEHELIRKLMDDPEGHRGDPLFITHLFVTSDNIERMLFVDGELK